MSNVPLIPVEILDHIVSFLAADDNPKFTYLKTCSLVSHSFLHFGRKHIFRTIVLDSVEESKAEIPLLSSLVSAQPIIATYVHVVTLKVSKGDNEKFFEYVIGLLKLFTNVQSFRLGGHFLDYNMMWLDWNGIPTELRDAIKAIFVSDTLIHLAVNLMQGMPIQKTRLSANLRRLHLGLLVGPKALNDSAASEDDSGTDSTPPTEAEMSEVVRKTARFENDFKQLEGFSAKCFTLHHLNFMQTLLEKTTHLTALCVTVGNEQASLGSLSKVIVPFLPTLKKIVIIHVAFMRCDVVPFIDLTKDLKALGQNVLEVLDLSMEVAAARLHILADKWSQLDTVLNDTSQWPCLKTVSLAITSRSRHSGSQGPALNFSRESFPRLSSSKTVTFEFNLKLE